MKVQDVMTKDPLTVHPRATLKEVAEILVREKISGLPVVDDEGHVVGVVSEGDILIKETAGTTTEKGFLARLLSFDPLEDLKLDARTAREAMTVPAITIGPRRPLTEAATTMIEQGVKRLPVVDDRGKLLGIVTRADLVRAFIRSDAEIAREIREDVLGRSLWIAPNAVQIDVENGEVRLSGRVETEADAELIPTFVQRVPGVVSVLSKIRSIDPNGGKPSRSSGR
jgi:CBS domain-containing protein